MREDELRVKMVEAWKGGDKFRKDVLSSILSTAKKVAIDEKSDVTEDIINRSIQKELKTAKEQVDGCPESRIDLKEEYTNRYNIINEFAPKMLSKDEIKNIIIEKCSAEIESKNKGLIMKAIMPILKGIANGKDINDVVTEMCK